MFTAAPLTGAPLTVCGRIRNELAICSAAWPKPIPLGVSLAILQFSTVPSLVTSQVILTKPFMARALARGG